MYDFDYDLTTNNLKDILFNISNEDCSGTRIQTLPFSDLLNPNKFNGKFADANTQIKIITSLIESGLDLNRYDTTDNWTYGHYLMREGSPKIIQFAFDNNFDFDLTTGINNWHSISLLVHNMVDRSLEEIKVILDIIDNKIDSINFETVNTEALLHIFNIFFNNKSEKVNMIMDVFNEHKNYSNYINDRMNMVISNYENIIPQTIKDVFIF